MIRDGARLEAVSRAGYPVGEIRIGDDVSIEQDVHITSAGLVSIGRGTSLTPRVTIAAASHPLVGGVSPNRAGDVDNWGAVVRIGEYVLLGANSVVLPGVTIGNHSTIGANSVVTKDIPPYSVVAGAPARVIRTVNFHE